MRHTIRMKKMLIVISIFILMLGTACSNDKKDDHTIELTISAAASMQDALIELQNIFEKEHQDVKIFFNFGASGALQQQIEQGAPVDLFFSASVDKFNVLVDKGLIDRTYYRDLIGNELVLIQNNQSTNKINRFDDLSEATIKRISIGTPESVPAGKYAKETLESQNLWSKVEEKLVFAKDVRQVLTYVETGNVDAGIVYKTDAISSPKVEMVTIADPKTHSPIIYPLGVVEASKQKEEARKLYEFFKSEKAKDVFEKHGFTFLN